MSCFINPYRFAAAGGEPPWSGAPGFIGNGTFTAVAGNVSFDVPYPADVEFNDILILSVIAYESTSGVPSISPPAGWTEIVSQALLGGTGAIVLGTFWKRADGTETGTIHITASAANSSNDAKSGIISNYRGCLSSGTPIEGAASNAANSTNPTGSSVTTTGSDRTVVNLIGKAITNADANCSPASGWTEQYEFSATAGSRLTAHVLHDKTVASASTEPAEVTTNTSVRWRVNSFALLPR